MQIIKQSKMPDGTVIQLEDWRENYSHIKALEIGAYPQAKNTNKNGTIRVNESFRVDLVKFESDEKAQEIFNKLERRKNNARRIKGTFL